MRGPEFEDADPSLPPRGFEFVWQAFLELSAGRGYGPSGLSYADVEAYARLYGIRWGAWEVDVLRRLDNVFLGSVKEAREAEKEGT